MKVFTTWCATCDWTGGPYASWAKADYAHRIHSCERWLAKTAAAERARIRDAAVDRTPKECRHKHATHVHGTHACYVLDQCRCHPCKDANSAYERNRARQQAYGRWNGLVDAEPAREHVRALQSAGMGWKTIAATAGVSNGAMTKLIYGTQEHGPSKRIRPDTEARLLAVTLNLADGARTPTAGTMRRLQALAAVGWSQHRLAELLGWSLGNFSKLIHGRCDHITCATARAVSNLYDQLWNMPPPATSKHQRAGITRAQAVAQSYGWVPPLAWDDETIDDPDATPHGGITTNDELVDHVSVDLFLDGHRITLSRPDRIEVVRRLAARGLSDAQIANRLGVAGRTVTRDRYEYGIPSTWTGAA